jgi:hypothetical protein
MRDEGRKISPMQRARSMRMWKDEQKESMDVIAATFGCTVPTVYNTLRLLKLHQVLQDAVDAGDLPLRFAMKLARLPHDAQLDAFNRMRGADATSGARAARSVAAAKRGEMEAIGRLTRALRPHDFLERWYCVLKSRPDRVLDARAVLAFVLGEPPPNDPVFLKTLAEAGYRPRRYEKARAT